MSNQVQAMVDTDQSAERHRTRYALVGCGHRALNMFAKPLCQDYGEVAELVGLCDANTHRLHHYQKELGGTPTCFTDFGAMLRNTRPQRVIVCTPDDMHDEFIVEALAFGCEQVISEKPMTTDAQKLRRILDAETKYPGKVIVTFNYRHAPLVSKVKALIAEGALGQVTSANLEWALDTTHGASYFRRWHGQKEKSGGLQVHKSTHHFDILNWWLDAEPRTVFAQGSLQRYGKAGSFRGERCLGCDQAKTCPFYFDMAADSYYKTLYLDAEHEDGYIRDRCVFRPEIDIEDTFQATISYDETVANYSLTAYAPWEGWRANLVGTEGRLEVRCYHNWPYGEKPGDTIDLYRHNSEESPRVDWGGGADDQKEHGGGDRRLREYLFGDRTDDPLGIMADSRAGALSAGVGFGVNRSLKTGQQVAIDTLIG